jgi:hypothetical protein
MPGADARPADCPVCGRPTGQDMACLGCGWTLRSGRRPGPVTTQLQKEYDERLSAAQRAFGARAAALAGSAPERFLPWIRGGRPDAAEWAAARLQAAAAVAGAADEETACREIVGLLADLGGGDEVAVVEIGKVGVAVIRVTLDPSGAPELRRDRPVLAWTEVLPTLSRQADERLLQLAGATAGQDTVRLHDSLAAGLPRLTGRVLVICRLAGWTIPEQAARQVSSASGRARLIRVAGAADADGPGSLLDSLAARMPLRREYGVVVALVDPATGAVRTGSRPLFRPGDFSGVESTLTLRRSPGAPGATSLALTVGGEVVSMYSVPPGDGLTYQVRAILDAPGRVRFIAPDGVVPDSRAWADVLATIPRRVDMPPGPVDLVCAMELAGTKEQVGRRKDLVRGLLELLADEYPGPDLLRVGLLGCTDHVFAPGEERRRVVRVEPLAAAASALGALAKFKGADVRFPAAAPIEDLLHEARRMLADSRPGGRATRLLMVARRRPHPRALGKENIVPCPFKCDWRPLLHQLRREAGTLCVTVTDTVPSRSSRAAIWADLGHAGLHALSGASVRRVGEDLGVLARHTQRIPIPLPDLE